MHELGVVIEVVEAVEEIVKEEKLTKVDKIVLQIGELSSMIPMYVERCYPAAVDGTILQDTKLEIEILPANGICRSCNKVFNLLANQKKCPVCKTTEWDILGGNEFIIKEIVAC
jgi:hydrogenase nickel incorporation protein HypA/HybF